VSAAIGTDTGISLLANAEMGQRLTDRYGKIHRAPAGTVMTKF